MDEDVADVADVVDVADVPMEEEGIEPMAVPPAKAGQSSLDGDLDDKEDGGGKDLRINTGKEDGGNDESDGECMSFDESEVGPTPSSRGSDGSGFMNKILSTTKKRFQRDWDEFLSVTGGTTSVTGGTTMVGGIRKSTRQSPKKKKND